MFPSIPIKCKQFLKRVDLLHSNRYYHFRSEWIWELWQKSDGAKLSRTPKLGPLYWMQFSVMPGTLLTEGGACSSTRDAVGVI